MLASLKKHPLLWLFAVLVLLRLPGFLFGFVDIDETDFWVVGQQIAGGELPYVDIAEQKPLLVYLFWGAGAWLFGASLLPMQLLALGWLFATCLVVRRAAVVAGGEERTGLVAAWLCGLASGANQVSVNAELLLNLPAAAALLCFVRAERKEDGRAAQDFLAGVFVGVASLFKHQGGILLFALVGAILWSGLRAGGRGWVLRALRVVLGFVLPWALCGGLYAALGHLEAFYEWNVVYNFGLAGAQAGSALARFAESTFLCVVVAAPLAWWLAIRESFGAKDAIRRGLVLALWLTWIPVSLGGRFYAHYYLQFVPALALLAAAPAAGLLARWRDFGWAKRCSLGLSLALPAGLFIAYGMMWGGLGRYPCQEPKSQAVGQWVRENTAVGSRMFVWGHYSPIYYLAGRLPGTRYHNTSVHMGDFDPAHLPADFDAGLRRSDGHVAATVRDLEVLRPEIVVDTAPANIHDWSKIPLGKFPVLADYIAGHYQLEAEPGGAAVYLRKKAAGLDFASVR